MAKPGQATGIFQNSPSFSTYKGMQPSYLPGEANGLTAELAGLIQQSVAVKYQQMLQTLRGAWVHQDQAIGAWQRMDFPMTKMKQLAHSAEEVAENGMAPDFSAAALELPGTFNAVLNKTVTDLKVSMAFHNRIRANAEAQKHSGLMSSLDLTFRQEQYEADGLRDVQGKSE